MVAIFGDTGDNDAMYKANGGRTKGAIRELKI